MQALITQSSKTAEVHEIPIPSIDDDEILVRNSAIALNPTDWKHIQNVTKVGTICGCDWSGYVVKLGKNVTSLAVGDHVAGFVQGGAYDDRGAFAQYVKTPADLAWKVPDGMLKAEEAATMGCAFWTAVQALFHPKRLGLTEPPEKADGDEWVFIYGGSTSVGMFALQLAHLAGYKVVTVASPRNFDLCKSLGADAVFDYNDPEVVEKIQLATRDTLHYSLDTISVLQSQTLTIKSFGKGPGKLIVVQQPQGEAQKIREDITIHHTLIYTSLGRAFSYGPKIYPASPEDRAHMAHFLKKVPELVSSGAIKPNSIKLMNGGLENVHEGLQILKDGKNSGEKVVYHVY